MDEAKLTVKSQAIRHWDEADRPREKLLHQGRRAVSDVELIAILLGSGSKLDSAVDLARKIMADMENDLHILARADVGELCKYHGLGAAKAVRIIAAMELGRRRAVLKPSDKPILNSSTKVYNYLRTMYQDLDHEEAWALFLNSGNRLVRTELIGKGGVDYTPVDIKIILRKAIEYKACNVILSHNHPSGTLKPSKADIYLTDRLIAAGKLFDIEVHDHIIFTDSGYMSFRDEGMME